MVYATKQDLNKATQRIIMSIFGFSIPAILMFAFFIGIMIASLRADTFPIDKENCIIQKANGFGYIVLASGYSSLRNDHNYIGKHRSYDIPAVGGTIFRATRAGTVKEVGHKYPYQQLDGTWKTNYGNYCIVKQNDGYSQLYAHAEVIDVKEGEEVAPGDKLGRIGSTGLVNSLGQQIIAHHLHYELRDQFNNKINPGQYWELPRDINKFCFSVLDQK